MIALLDTPDDLTVAAKELGCPVEQLLTPLTRRKPRSEWFAVDNGCFSKFEEKAFLSLLERNKQNRDKCRFVTCPDIVGNARRTLEVFNHWRHNLAGWPVALVAQDGLENLDIPWEWVNALFIGGSTAWKLSRAAADCIKTAKILGKWVHAGRVNTPARFEYFEALGVDSIDGTGLAQYSWMRTAIYNRVEGLFAPTDTQGREMVSSDSGGLVGAAPILGEGRQDAQGAGA